MVASLDGYERRPERDWLRIEAPDIRIVPPDLAAAADARLAGTRDVFARGPHGMGLATGDRSDVGTWTQRALAWLREHGVIDAAG